ncbi:hypothetical protein DB30_04829 [Enhygromyxa salina]|uniref:Uncharacterized protein n=1 Tax=Enhygromyxa salina TaxID=215803 RepID=A0A0C2D8D6_9BACT|nr:hypothetical protein DB30_04829 [Enhygromyxa salina]
MVLATLLCLAAPPEAFSALIASAASASDDVQTAPQFEALDDRQDAHWRHRDASPSSAKDIVAVESESENENEDASSSFRVLPSSFKLQSAASIRRHARHEQHRSADIARLLVSTGLGRGPPLA